MSDVTELLAKIESFPRCENGREDIDTIEEAFSIIDKCKALLQSHAVIDKDTLGAMDEIVTDEGIEFNIVKAELSRLTTED